MQLVVMAAVLALAGAGQRCGFLRCHLATVPISVEVCGRIVEINTTKCEGQCFQMVPGYIGTDYRSTQNTCNGDWSYEVKYIEGCSEGVTYPVARNCRCRVCNPDEDTDCKRYRGNLASCSF